MKNNRQTQRENEHARDMRLAKVRAGIWIIGGLLLFAVAVAAFATALMDGIRREVPQTAEITVNGTGAVEVIDHAEFFEVDTPAEGIGAAKIDLGRPDYTAEPWMVPEYVLDVPLDRDFQIWLHGLCEEEGLPFTLAVAVIEAESGYDPAAVSPSDDWGLMQINAVCHGWLAEELGIKDFLDPWQNARAGVHILGGYYRTYGYASGTLMAYNMGQAAAEWYFSQGVYATDYSDRVMGILWRLEATGR